MDSINAHIALVPAQGGKTLYIIPEGQTKPIHSTVITTDNLTQLTKYVPTLHTKEPGTWVTQEPITFIKSRTVIQTAALLPYGKELCLRSFIITKIPFNFHILEDLND